MRHDVSKRINIVYVYRLSLYYTVYVYWLSPNFGMYVELMECRSEQRGTDVFRRGSSLQITLYLQPSFFHFHLKQRQVLAATLLTPLAYLQPND